MNKSSKLVLASALILFLSACGTDQANEEPVEETNGTEEVETSEGTETEEEATEEEATEEEATEEETTEETEEQSEPIGERVESDNQPFSLELIDTYELTAEEPNRDVVFSKENDSQFMRIETFAKADADREQLVQTLKDTVTASGSGDAATEISAEELPQVEAPAGYELDIEGGKVSGYVFETELHFVRVMIYDSSDTPKFEEFIQMIETIETK